MKDFAGSSITYYGLARERLINKFPWLASLLVILALICMTGLAIYLISDLVSYASNSDYKAEGIGFDQKVSENGISISSSDKETIGNMGTNSSPNASRQTNVQNLSKINSSLQSGQSAKAIALTVKSSSSRSSGSKHHSSSSSKSSSSNSAKVSVNTSNLTNESATAPLLTNATATLEIPANVTANASASSQGAEAISPSTLGSLPMAAISNLANPAGKITPIEPESTIVFKTETIANGGAVSDSADKGKSSSRVTKSIRFKSANAKSLATEKSNPTATSPSSKTMDAKDKIRAKKDRIEQAMKKKAALMRSKAA
jgi:hypothetical protein